jgi:hypothetical protein
VVRSSVDSASVIARRLASSAVSGTLLTTSLPSYLRRRSAGIVFDVDTDALWTERPLDRSHHRA